MLSLTLKSLFRLARPCCLVMMPKTAAIPLFLLFISAALIGGAWGKVPSSAQSPVIRKDSKISAAAISNAFVQQNQNSMVHPSTHHGMSLRT